jgi:hypothetical protein
VLITPRKRFECLENKSGLAEGGKAGRRTWLESQGSANPTMETIVAKKRLKGSVKVSDRL